LWPHSPYLHLTYFSQNWYDWRDDVVLPQNRFVGGIRTEPHPPPPAWLDSLPSNLPLILVTLGSTFNYEPQFFRITIKAIASLACFPVIVTHNADLTAALSADTPPELALILETAERAHLFPRLRGVVQHGGPGITHAAILHALPQVIVAPGPGQGTQAHLVSRAGLGRFLHLEEIRLENLRNLIASVLTDPQIQANAHAYQAQFAALPGISGAAAALEALAD
jgi:UDP:flavonoid glycosyltransferase YjiC (YdhE family)